MTPKEQMRVQVLNSLLAEQIVLDQAAELMGISVVATGILAAVKFRTFSHPFINVSLEASSRPCSQDDVQIGVAAKL